MKEIPPVFAAPTVAPPFVPETLIPALDELERAWTAARADPAYREQLTHLLVTYAGRPTPLFRADRLAKALGLPARLYLKREDLLHTGAHKLNNTLGQALLAKRMGKQRVIAETGAGQHGVATATVCALLGLDCIVYMGSEDVRRQSPNVDRMKLLGAEVRSVEAGTRTLKDAMNEAIRDWVTNVRTTYYCIGSAAGPHPYPVMVRELQKIIGEEIAEQIVRAEGRLPDALVACVGGGSNAIGALHRFVGEPAVALYGVEAAGHGLESGKHGARRRTDRSRKRTRSARGSITRAWDPSCPTCATRAGSRSSPPPTRRRSRRSRSWRAAKASSARWSRRMRSRRCRKCAAL